MRKIEELYRLYCKQCSYQVAGNEWAKPLAFHIWLSQVLRKPNPEQLNGTVPMTYRRSGREISIREHLFLCQGSRCLKYDTQVLTEEGSKKIGKLNPDTDKVLTWNFKENKIEPKRFKKINTGKPNTYIIKTTSGYSICATSFHTFFVKEEGKIVERFLKDLREGDVLFNLKKHSKVLEIRNGGYCQTYDLEVEDNHNFVLWEGTVVHNSGKGELMNNTVDILRKSAERTGWNDVKGHYMDGEPTPQFLRGGNEDISNGKPGMAKWKAVSGRLKVFSLLSWSEGEALVSPKSSYGDLKHVILSACDDGGEISVTARKDLIVGGKESTDIPSFRTTCSIMTGSVYKDTFAMEVLQSGLLQRFLFSYYTPSYEKNISQLGELTMGLVKEVGEGGEDARKDFLDYFMDNIHGSYSQESVEWTAAGAETLSDILKSDISDPNYRGRKLDTFNSFVNGTQKHIEKIATSAAIVDGIGMVSHEHVEYAWKICKPVFDSYLRLLGAKFLPDLSNDDKIRLGVIREILSNEKGGMLQKDLLAKLKTAKKVGDWDMGDSASYKFLSELEKYGAIQTRKAKEKKGIFYRICPK